MAKRVKNYTDDFKKQLVTLKMNGKSVAELSQEYNVAKSTINKWVNDYNSTGSFKDKDNRRKKKMNY
ncbi:MAG: transposase [Lachnospirales bacterium]